VAEIKRTVSPRRAVAESTNTTSGLAVAICRIESRVGAAVPTS